MFKRLHGPVPRLSAVYDIFGKGKTAIKASFGVYSYNPSVLVAENVNPISVTRKRYTWDGALPFVPDPSKLTATIGGLNRSLDPDFKLARTIEYTAGLDQELIHDMTVRFNFVRKFERDRWQLINAAIPFSAYNISVPFTDPGRDGQTGTSDDRRLTLYSLDPKFVGLRRDVLTNNPAFSSGFTTYEFEVVKRFSRKWQLLGGADWIHYKTWDESNSPIGAETSIPGVSAGGVPQDPNNLIFNAGRNYWQWQVKGLASYQLPKGITLSGSLRSIKGEPYGRRSNTPRLNQGVVTVMADPVGTFFYPTINLIDLRVQKTFAISERWGTVDAILDWFNVSNSNAIIGVNDLTGTSFNRQVTQILSPRIARLGVRYSF